MSIWGTPVLLGGGGNGYWRVRFYRGDGALLHTEYVLNGGDCAFGAAGDWAISPGGAAVSGILENVRKDLDLYLVEMSLLAASAPEDILAEGLCELYVPGSFSLGGITLVGTPTVQISGALRMESGQYAVYSENSTGSRTAYGLLAMTAGGNYGRFLSLWNAASGAREQLFCQYGTSTGTLIWSSYGNDSTVGSFTMSEKHVYAISVNASTMKARFYLDGTYLGEKAYTYTGAVYWTNNGASQKLSADVYYGAVVSGAEPDAAVIANQQSIMAHYGMGA